MNKIFQGIIKLVQQIADFCWINKLKSMIIIIICFIFESINNPHGFINWFMCAFIDLLVFPLPETPEEMKLINFLVDFFAGYQWLGSGIIVDIILTPVFFLSALLIFKLIKFFRG